VLHRRILGSFGTPGSPSQGDVLAWLVFSGDAGGSPSILASFNVASLTDNDVGDHTVNFLRALTGTQYAVAGFGRGEAAFNSTDATVSVSIDDTGLPTSTTLRVGTINANTVPIDALNTVVVMGRR
jgi:hypothetical protein